MAKPDADGNITRKWVKVREYTTHTIYKYGEDGIREYSLPRDMSSEQLDALIEDSDAHLMEVAGWNVFLRNLKLTLGG